MIVLSAVLPVFIVILSGYILKQRFLKSDAFWDNADWLIFHVLIPIMLISILATAPFTVSMLSFGALIFVVTTLTALLSLLFKPLMNTNNAGFTSVLQGAIRVNFFISLSITSVVYGTEGIATISFALLFLIPSSVLLSIMALQKYGQKAEGEKSVSFLNTLIQNPVIIANVIGLSIGMFINQWPTILDNTFDIFARMSLPLSLLAIGARLQFKSIGAHLKPLLFSSFLGLIISPSLGLLLGPYLGLSPMQIVLSIFILGVPAAASAITFASKMGGDKELMSSILTGQTILSLFSLPAFIFIAKYLGYL